MRVTSLKRWAALADEARDRFINDAVRYLADGSCSPSEWLGHDKIWFPADAGFRALILLLENQPDSLQDLEGSVCLTEHQVHHGTLHVRERRG